MHKNKSRWTLYCFSPPVMIATVIIELGLLLYVLFKYSLRSTRIRLACLILALLAGFQIAEFNICTNSLMSSENWARFGFVAITFLPALCLHLVFAITKIRSAIYQFLTWFFYATAFVWAAIFAFSNQVFLNQVCGGNYVIFNLRSPYDLYYLAYYYFILVLIIAVSWSFIKMANKVQKFALRMVILGVFSFLIPTTIVNILYPETTAAIPSIMCGFAVLWAIILVFGIVKKEPKLNKSKPIR